MNEQLELSYEFYGGTPPHVRHSRTSRAAACSMVSGASTVREIVLEFIRRRNGRGATDDEIEKALGLRHQTVSARRRELVLDGKVSASGEERKTRSGRLATVWCAVTTGA